MAAPPKPRWLEVLSSIAYELKPFSLPTKHDLINSYHSTRVTIKALWEDLCNTYKTVQPVVVRFLHSVTLKQAGLTGAWLCLYLLFVYWEFGLVFLIVSAMGAMYLGTGNTRGRGQLSAWSVFNEGFRPLLGTLDAGE